MKILFLVLPFLLLSCADRPEWAGTPNPLDVPGGYFPPAPESLGTFGPHTEFY